MENHLYDYWPIIDRPQLALPDGARLAFYVGVNIEHYEVDKPSTSMFTGTAMLQPDPLNYGWRDYAPRVGIWRMMDVLDKYGIRGTALINSDACRLYPRILEEGNKRNWAWVAHGKNNSRFQTGMPVDEERQALRDVVDTIRESTGQKPRGWLGPALTETFNTPDLLTELGVDYILDWCNDEQPFPVNVKQGRMISVPYSIELNDVSQMGGKPLPATDFYQMVVDQFDVLYEEGIHSARVMALCLHPFIINQPFRHKYLDRALAYITSHDDVWLTTSDDVAEWYYRTGYEQAVQALGTKREALSFLGG